MPRRHRPPRQRVQRLRGHGEHRRRAGAELRDARAQLDRGRAGGEVRERCERVAGPELGAPHRVDAEPLGLAHELHGLGSERRAPMPTRKRHRAASARCFTPSTVCCMLALDLADAAAQHPHLLAGVVRDRHGRAGRSGSHDVGEPQAGAALSGFEIESPTSSGVVGVGGAPTEGARFVADVDEARDRPLADRGVLVAPVEHGADAAVVARPFGADELVGEPCREVEIRHQRPHRGWRGGDVDLGDRAGAVLEPQLVARTALGRQAEAVEVGDRPGGVARGALELGALRVGDREQDDLGHVLGDAEDLLDLRRVLQRGGDPGRAQPAGTQREAEAPSRLDDGVEQAGAPAAIVSADDGRDDDGGDFGEMFGQVRGRCHHLLARVAGAVQPLGGGGHERQRGLAIELAELVLDPLLADDDPSPAAEVAAGRRLLGEVDAVEQQLVVDRSLEVEPPTDRRVSWRAPRRSGRRRRSCRHSLESCGHRLVPRRPGPRIAVLAGRELVGRDAGLVSRPGRRRDRDRDRWGATTWPACTVSSTATVTSTLARFVVSVAVSPSTRPKPVGVGRRDAQGAVGVLLPPRRVAQDRVRGERAPLTSGQEQRPVGVVTGRSLVAQLGELVEKLGDVEVDEPVVGLDPRPRRLPGVVGEHDTGRAVDDRVEQPVAGVGARAESGAFDAVGVASARSGSPSATAQPPPPRRAGASRRGCGRARPARRRPASSRSSSPARTRRANSPRSRAAARPQLLDGVAVEEPERVDESGVDLRLGQRADRAVRELAGGGGRRSLGSRS